MNELTTLRSVEPSVEPRSDDRARRVADVVARRRDSLRDDAALVDAIVSGLSAAQRRWPGFVPDEARTAEWVLDRWLDDALLAELHIPELALCAACAAGDVAAIQAFVREYVDELARACKRHPTQPFDDARQRLHEHLFVGGPRPPKIRAYSGRGKLRSWVRIVATRLLIDMSRERGHEADPLDLCDDDVLPADDADPELSLLKSACADAFEHAFTDAVASLEPRQRNLLRQQLVFGATYEEIAGLYRVSRATAARWIAHSRADLVAAVRSRLRAQLGIADRELDSIARLVRSRLEISLRRHLDTRA
jgi:RNA polymerase sigma-70 factor (ECF subfamily)